MRPAKRAACASVRKNPPSRILSLCPLVSLSRSCVFYCKLRSLARGQAFHLGRCIPADTHERYMLAYVSRVRVRENISITYICEEKSSYVLPADFEVRFTCTCMIRVRIEKVSWIWSLFFSSSECRVFALVNFKQIKNKRSFRPLSDVIKYEMKKVAKFNYLYRLNYTILLNQKKI